MTRSDEQVLISAAKAGDDAAMAALIRHHQPSLYAFMLKMTGRPDVAEDVVQEAFVRVLKNLERFDPKYRFSTWLFTIAKRLYVNWSQKHKPLIESAVVDARQCDDDLPPVTIVAAERRHDIRRSLTNALRKLTDSQREIVLLFHQQEWSIQEISNYLDMPEGTIKSHLHRARLRMRQAIETEQRQTRMHQPDNLEFNLEAVT